MKNYKCPLCGSKLPKRRYEAVLHIQREREKAQKADIEKSRRLLEHAREAKASLRDRLKETRQQLKQAKSEWTKKGMLSEKKRQERLTAGVRKKLELAKVRISQLEKGTTPQTEGLEFEGTLWKRLRKEFPQDRVEHKGKSGDILHQVVFHRQTAGSIIYECKRTPRILPTHVRQAACAKKIQEAHFAILVTTGARKGFSGLACEGNVLVVAPPGVVPLAHLLRDHLVEMTKAKLDNDERTRVATRLLDHVMSPNFKIAIEEVIGQSEKANKSLFKEMRVHARVWQERHAIYQAIQWDASRIRENVGRVINDEKPLPLENRNVRNLPFTAVIEGQASAPLNSS